MLKDTPPDELLAAIRVIAAGDALLSPGITRRLISEFTSKPEPSSTPPAALAEITDREREVLTLIGLGMSNDEIGAVKAHVPAARQAGRPRPCSARHRRMQRPAGRRPVMQLTATRRVA